MSLPTTVPIATATVPMTTATANPDRGRQVLGEIVSSVIADHTKILTKAFGDSIQDYRKADGALYPKLVAMDERLTAIEKRFSVLDRIEELLKIHIKNTQAQTQAQMQAQSQANNLSNVRVKDPGPIGNMFDKKKQLDDVNVDFD